MNRENYQPAIPTSRTATQQCENRQAHEAAGAIYEASTGETFVVHNGTRYSFKEFSEKFPTKGWIGKPNIKGDNPDQTRNWLSDNK